MVRVAVDGMGGDFAPHAIVKGVALARAEQIAEVVIVGDEAVIRPLISNHEGIEILHTPVYVEMGDTPSTALRKKKASSMNMAMELVRSKKVDAVVTAGNSGAAMAFAIFTLGRYQTVDRPAIATINPTVNGASVLLDAGGNVDCKPLHLSQFAVMGECFARSILGIPSPRVGLLSNGEEETKGNDLTRQSHAIIKEMGLNYIGYVEGTDLYNGNADVVVSDGFVGNVALKISEGIAESLLTFFKYRIRDSLRMRLGYLLLNDLFKDLAKKVDYSEYGGAPLLGVDGVCIICHGKSNERAIKNAILKAKEFVEKGLNESLKQAMEGYQLFNRQKER